MTDYVAELGHLARYQLARGRERVAGLGPAWWSAIAGAVAAGAVVAPGHRLLGALGGGLAMIAIAATLGPTLAATSAPPSSPSPAPLPGRDRAGAPEAATLADLSAGGCL